MATADYSTWLTKQQAAEAIGVSTKTVEQLADDGKLEKQFWRRPTGGPQLAVYNPDDVARIAQERHPAPGPFVLPAVPAAAGNGHGRRRSSADPQALTVASAAAPGDDLVREFLHGLLRAAATPATSENSEKFFLTIPEAAALSGFSRAYLRRKCRTGWSGAIKDVAWKIRRKDLEQL